MLENLKRELRDKTRGWDIRTIEPVINMYGGREAFVRHHIALLETIQRQNLEAAIQATWEANVVQGRELIGWMASIIQGPGVDETNRYDVMMRLIRYPRAGWIGWPVFFRFLHRCDTSDYANDPGLVETLKKWREDDPMEDFLDADNRAFFDALPDQVDIYRPERLRRDVNEDVFWLAFRETTEGLAGQSNPRIAVGRVRKVDILAVIGRADRRALLVDPTDIRNLRIEDVPVEPAVRASKPFTVSDEDALKRTLENLRKTTEGAK